MTYALACRSRPGAENSFEGRDDDVLEQLERGEAPWLESGWLARAGAVSTPGQRHDVEEEFLELFAATGMEICLGAVRTFYSACDDMIHLADWRASDPADVRRDWIHELVHATGHPMRLGRDLPLLFGSTAHGVEDLIAEIGASIVCFSLGIAPALRHPGSIGLWVDLLRCDDRAFGRAVRSAVAAAGYLFERRDAQAAAFDQFEAGEARAAQGEAARAAAARRRKRQQERERWASGLVTGLAPRESLTAVRHGDPLWQNLHSNSS